jgi:hypothetical protein
MSASEFGKAMYELAKSEISHRIFGDKIYDAGNDAFNKQVEDATNAALKTGQYTSLEGTVEQTPNINEPRTALQLMTENANRLVRLIEAQKALKANQE